MGAVAKWLIVGQAASAKRKRLLCHKFISFRVNELHIASDAVGTVIVHENIRREPTALAVGGRRVYIFSIY